MFINGHTHRPTQHDKVNVDGYRIDTSIHKNTTLHIDISLVQQKTSEI